MQKIQEDIKVSAFHVQHLRWKVSLPKCLGAHSMFKYTSCNYYKSAK